MIVSDFLHKAVEDLVNKWGKMSYSLSVSITNLEFPNSFELVNMLASWVELYEYKFNRQFHVSSYFDNQSMSPSGSNQSPC